MENSIGYYCLVFVFSIFSLFAVLYSYSDLTNYASFCNSINVLFVLTVFAFFILFYKYALNKISRFSVLSKSIGVVAGFINVLGRNFMLYNGLEFFYKDKAFAVVFSLLAAFGYGFIYATLFEGGWNFFEKVQESEPGNHDLSYTIFEKHPFLYPFLFICFFWLPYLITFYPGIIHIDALGALRQYYGVSIWTSNHPVIGVLLMGYTMDIGKLLGNDNYGCTIYIVLQYIIFSITLAYGFVFYSKWKTPYFIRWITLLIFSFFPVIPMYVVNEIKDTLYYVAVLWLLFFLMEGLGQFNNRLFYKISTTVMFICCLRKEGIIICIFYLIVLLIVRDRIYDKWKKFGLSIIMGICLSTFFINLASGYYNVKPAPMREALSLPVQQTARFIKYYSKDVTRSEWQILNSVFNNKAKELGSFYNPNRSDEVKGKMIYTLTKKQYKKYFRVWLTHFIRHPGCYFSAAFNQMYGYFYIEKPEFYGIHSFGWVNFKHGNKWYTTKVIVTDNPNSLLIREKMKSCFKALKDTWIIGTLFHPATYTWLLFFALTMLIHFKQHKYVFFFIIPLVILAVSCASPLNASIRYSFPIMLTSFLLTAFSIYIIRKRKVAV